MYSNLFVSTPSALSGVRLQNYALRSEVDPREFHQLAKGLESRLLRRGVCAATLGEGIQVCTDGMDLSREEEVGNAIFALSGTASIVEPKMGVLQGKLVQNALKMRAWALDYNGPEGGKFYKREPYGTGFWNYHDAFESNIDIFHDGRIGIWLDPTTRWTQTVSNYVNWARSSGMSNDAIVKYLIGKTAYCPSVSKSKRFKAEIVDVTFETIGSYQLQIQGRPYSVYDYWTKVNPYTRWLASNGMTLDRDETPVITVQFGSTNSRPSYPPSILNLRIDLDDPDMPFEALEEKKILNPRERIESTFALYDELFEKGLAIGEVTLSFDRRLFEWTSPEGRAYGTTIPLASPTLRLGGGGFCSATTVWTDPDICSALQKHGPVDKNETTTLDYVVPREFEKEVGQLHTNLAGRAEQLKLGKFVRGQTECLDRVHPDRYSRACRTFAKRTNGVVVVVLPKESVSQAYYAAKSGLGQEDTKSQMIRWQTASRLATKVQSSESRTTAIGLNLAAQIYDKSLKQGESIWHLVSPAGGLDPGKTIYFMGFDVSRAPERRKEAAAYAAVCDSYGRILYRRSIDTHKGEKIQANVLSDWFYDVASNSFDEISNGKSVDELILFKDGPVPPNQIVDYTNGSEDAKHRLIQENIMTDSGNIRILSVVKRGPHRIYGNEWHDYRTQNTAVVISPREAIVVTASAGHGTASPVRIRLEHQLKEDMRIDQAIRIFNDLRYLDYTSLYKQPKTILPLHIVQNLAKLSKEDIRVPYIPR